MYCKITCRKILFFSGILTLQYGFLLNDTAMLVVNIVAIVLNAFYVIFYYKYSGAKYEEVLKPLSIGVGVVAIFLGYAQFENPDHLEFRYGLVLTILMLVLLGSPLLDMVCLRAFVASYRVFLV